MQTLLKSSQIDFDEPAVSAGLALLAQGGDFADGVISYEGRRLGGEPFVSFDRKAVTILKAQGHSAPLIA
jgi:predicted nucleic-acid-binding protein